MNGYKFMADSYREVIKRESTDEILREHLEKQIKTYDYLASVDEDEIYRLYDTGIFNEITKSYCKKAMENCNMKPDEIETVLGEIKWLHDTMGSQQI